MRDGGFQSETGLELFSLRCSRNGDCHAAISTHPPYHPIPAAPTSSSFDIPVGKSGPPGLLFCFYQLSTSRVPTIFFVFFFLFLSPRTWPVVCAFSYQLPSSFFILVRIVSHFLSNCSDKDSDADHVWTLFFSEGGDSNDGILPNWTDICISFFKFRAILFEMIWKCLCCVTTGQRLLQLFLKDSITQEDSGHGNDKAFVMSSNEV